MREVYEGRSGVPLLSHVGPLAIRFYWLHGAFLANDSIPRSIVSPREGNIHRFVCHPRRIIRRCVSRVNIPYNPLR